MKRESFAFETILDPNQNIKIILNDRDRKGLLLLLTDGGRLQHRLSHQQFQVERIRDSEALNRLREGVRIKNYFTSKALVRRLPQKSPLL